MMLAIFCLRLACGLAGALLLLPSREVNPRFYRTHFLTIATLTATAAVSLRGVANAWMWAAISLVLIFSFLGSLAWMLEGAPGGNVLVILTTLVLAGILIVLSVPNVPADIVPQRDSERKEMIAWPWLLAAHASSAAFLGSALTAMLLGHFYLIAPAMSLTPLLRLLSVLQAAIGIRAFLAGGGLWLWSRHHSWDNLGAENLIWLGLRWGPGLLGCLVLAWMARESAKIRSTQSATGILYIVVIFSFLGELTAQLLLRNTGVPL
jgi:hypothetical protein